MVDYHPLILPRESDPVIWCEPPDEAPYPHLERLIHPQFGVAVDIWPRTDLAGKVIGGQIRWIDKSGDKQDRQFRWARVNGYQGWCLRAGPKPWDLFGLHDLVTKPQATVLVVEGPKTREAASRLFPGWAVVSACGAQTPGSFDWCPLYGRKVVVWPDADIPGLQYATKVCEMLGLLIDTNVIQVPLDGPAGWDLADPIPEGWDIEDLLQTATPALVRHKAEPDVADETEEEDRRSLYLPDEFWESRDTLKQVRDWCWRRRFPLDSTFISALTRISAMIAPINCLETGLGEARPPILFAMLVADSGGGKTIAISGAKSLIPKLEGLIFLDGASPGSGEGIDGAFCKRKGETGDWEQIRNNAWFVVDEGEIIQQIRRRNGATLGGKLRQLWTGGDLVTQLAGQIRCARDYTCGLVLAMQFSVLVEILSENEASLGTPGRFLWCHAGDPNLGKNPGREIYTPRLFYTPPGRITMDNRIVKEIDEAYCRRMRGEEIVEAIDAHRNYLKARVAALLCITDGRDHVAYEDWELAEIVMNTSDHVRTCCINEVSMVTGKAFKAELDRQVMKTRVQRAVVESGHNPDWNRAVKISRRCRILWGSGKVMTEREARKCLKTESGMTPSAVAFAESMGWIEAASGSTWRPGPEPVPERYNHER